MKVVATGSQSSGTKRIIVEGEVVESLPSRGLFGYSPPAVTKNPKSVKFGFGAANTDIACYFSVKEISDGEGTIFFGISSIWLDISSLSSYIYSKKREIRHEPNHHF